MTSQIYLFQISVLAVLCFVLLRHVHWIYRLQVCLWTIGVMSLLLRFGVDGQLNFYSNDQRLYESIVRQISLGDTTLDIDYWMTFSKAPFTLPASALTMLGIAPGLALKSVSLVCLLGLTRLVLRNFELPSAKSVFITLYLSACGGIGTLFSVLALRETMMMLFTTAFFVSRSLVVRLLCPLLLFLLRPHLAICLVVAVAVAELWNKLRNNRLESVVSVVSLTIGSVVSGYFFYSIGTSLQYGLHGVFGHQWGIAVVTRVTSNFFGLQFLTARVESVELSLGVLLALRILLSETIVIPAMFIGLLILRPSSLDSRARSSLIAFSMYVGIATNTDFNSFRQNIPFMPIMGLTVIHLLTLSRIEQSVASGSRANSFPQRQLPQLGI